MTGVYIFLAEGFEEIEALATLDILRRGGVAAQTVSITEDQVVIGAHGTPVVADLAYSEFKADAVLDQAEEDDCLIFPGGLPGAKHLSEKEELMDLMKQHFAEGGKVAAICAAPGLVLTKMDCFKGRKFTCYDGFQSVPISMGGTFVAEPSVKDGNLITGRGPGGAIDFALEILASLRGQEVADGVRAGMLL